MSRSVQVDISGIDVNKQLAGIIKTFCAETGALARTRAQQLMAEETRDRSGAMRTGVNFIVKSNSDKVWLEFYNDVQHAVYHEYGTGIYGPKRTPIRPKRAKLLSWIDPDTGKRVFAKQVRGVPAKKYLRRSIDYALEKTTGRKW